MPDAPFVKIPADSATSLHAIAPQRSRPRLPPRASSERVRPPRAAPLRATSSVRAFVRLASIQAEAPAVAATRSTRTSSVTSRSTMQMEFTRVSVATRSSVVPFLRAMSSLCLLGDEVTFRCHICFDDVIFSKAVTLAACGHKYCHACFKPFLELKITEGNVYPVCFHPLDTSESEPTATCGVAVSQDQIQQIVNPEVYNKYDYFRFNKEHQHARECPYCSHLQECAGPENPAWLCDECGELFCFFHGNAHDGGTCADYELKNAHEESLNRAVINEISKPCPGCQRDVEKNGGCNHMKCIGCDTNFCWLCGEIVEDTPLPSHYAAAVGGSCSGKQFDGTGQDVETLRWLERVDNVFFAILILPAFLVACVLAPVVWLCENRRESFAHVFKMIQTMFIIGLCALLGCALALVIWVIYMFVLVIVDAVLSVHRLVTGCLDRYCGCCRHARESRSGPTVADDLEAGLVVQRQMI